MSTDREARLASLREHLLSQRNAKGVWEGCLSSSALASAIAVFALAVVDARRHAPAIARGLDWICADQHDDGGWGDSPESPTNLTATLLCWAALTVSAGNSPRHARADTHAAAWLRRTVGSLAPSAIRDATVARYGDDRTFAAPILAMLALSGRLGDTDAWDLVPQLPFELSLLPAASFRAVKLTVVSYALPALVAIGLVRHQHRPSRHACLRAIRRRVIPHALRTAERMQPSNGGYEEAAPLTGFVTMSLAAAGHTHHRVVQRGVDFLLASMRADGSWPIDTDLATWVTTLSVIALSSGPDNDALPRADRMRIRNWLLAQQAAATHPLTFGASGGWGWSDLPGAMPDADDTAGVLLALRRLLPLDHTTTAAAARGVTWLLNLQNSDGGIPTFSRGWGRLPFDRSCPDITAHALWAFHEWRGDLPPALARRTRRAMSRALHYLAASQAPNGSWTPLWFGNQAAPNQANPVYGTARVVLGLHPLASQHPAAGELAARGRQYLEQARHKDGGWGGAPGAPPTHEETGLAVAALATQPATPAVEAGIEWLMRHTMDPASLPAAPIGLYFASLWYSERLYPVLAALTGLR